MNASELRSPFVERVINLLPRGHEDAMKQAFYNVAALTLFIALGGAAMSVYFILEPFVKPLLWAILVGSVLYPIKQKSVVLTRGWLTQIIDLSAEWIGTVLLAHLKILLVLGIGVPLVYTIQNHYSISDLVQNFEQSLFSLHSFLESVPTSFTALAGSCFFGLLGASVTVLSPSKSSWVANLSWMFILSLILFLLGSSFCVFVILPILLLGVIALAIRFGWLPDVDCVSSDDRPTGEGVTVNVVTPNSFSRLMRKRIFTAALSSLSTPISLSTPSSIMSIGQKPSSNRYIYGALWACMVVQLWRHMWLLHFIPIPLICFLIKSGGTYFNLWTFLHAKAMQLGCRLNKQLNHYKDLIFPQPIKWLFKAVVFLDRMVLRRLLDQVDAVVTVVIIFVVVVLTVMASVFIAIQIYGESVQLLQLGTSLVNQTISHPEARQWLPQGIDQMVNISMVVDNAYAYGKSGIATLVKNAINEKDPARSAQIERVLLEALDRVQTAWLSQGDSALALNKTGLPEESSFFTSNLTAVKPPLLRRLSQDFLNITVLMNYGRENVGTVFSILDSVWTLLKGNLSLVFKSTTAILSILIGGGTTILNFFVNSVVFLTALYYLLAASYSQYKPAQLVSFLSPGGGNTLGMAMEEAINTVCMASLKFSVFYGLWTWLMHTIFRVNFVVIPAALAALLGAVPFLGTYWGALPAALDLWLVQNRGAEAILLMAFQFAPTLWVDAAFYAEVKGGGHPYLTGLAVAGGIFWLGVEGAIIGPLLLCVLLVVVSVYTTLVQNDTPAPTVESSGRWLHRRILRTDTIG